MYNALANTNNISVGGVGICGNGNERMRIGSTTLWRRHTSNGTNHAIERTLLSGGVIYNQLSGVTIHVSHTSCSLNSENELLGIYIDSLRSVNHLRSSNRTVEIWVRFVTQPIRIPR